MIAHFGKSIISEHRLSTEEKRTLLRSTMMPRVFSARTFMVTGALLVVFYLYFFQDFTSKYVAREVKVEKYESQTRAFSRSSPDKFLWSECEKNMNAASVTNFSSLPGNIQDFLYYRHCRHFPMLLDIPDKCGGASGSMDVFLLLVIKSSPWNYDRREVLRNTWAKERLQNGVWIRRLFISGTTSSGFEKKRLSKLLELEQQRNNDILQWDFSDTFYNLTLKQMLFLEWMERNCPHVHFLFNGDDDVFTNTDNMVQYLQSFKDNDGSKHLFAGHLIQYVGPIRIPESKYFIPVQVHESELYPPYCGGGGFILSGYTAFVIYNMSHHIPLLPIDDVYMGICLAEAGLRPEHHLGVRTAGLHIPGNNIDYYDPCHFREMLLVHRFLPANMYFMWHRLHEPDLDCSTKTKS